MSSKKTSESNCDVSHTLSDDISLDLSILRKTGYFSEILREHFKNTIYARQFTIELVARVFGVTTASVHKWINGSTKRLPVASRRKMESFLNGQCEDEIIYHSRRNQQIAEDTIKYNVPNDFAYLMERIRKIHEICSQSNELSRIFIEKMDAAMLRSLRELLPPILHQLTSKDDNSGNSGGSNGSPCTIYDN